jgi:hypothetical protein
MVNMMPRFFFYGVFARHGLVTLACFATQALGVMVVEPAFAQQSGPNANLERCRAIGDDPARLRCFENLTRKPTTNSGSRTLGAAAGTWRLVRTPNPSGGPDAVSIMQTADTAKSDFDLAGLALRCQDGGIEVLVVLVGALSLRAHPKVVVSAAGKTADFSATIVPPGASLLLPQVASELASGPWAVAGEVAIRIEPGLIEGAPSLIRGVVPLSGLGSALPTLLANCPSQ